MRIHTARFSFEPSWAKGLVKHLTQALRGFFWDLLVLCCEHLDKRVEGGVPKLCLADRSHVFPNIFSPVPILNLNAINTKVLLEISPRIVKLSVAQIKS